MATTEQEGLLAGIRVIDLATERAELAGRLLADLGAEVIKVEPPGGAPARFVPPFDGDESLYWAAVALGKRSVVLDIESESGRDAVRELASGADVLIESFDPGVMAGLGLGYGDLSARNPGLIYVSVTPYGQSGPAALRPATEMTVEASGGLLGLQGDGDRPPVPVGYPQPAFHGGAQAATDVTIALNERARSGRGQHLDVSMQAAVVWTLMNATGYPANTGGDPPHTSEQRTAPPLEIAPGVAYPHIWPCKDGWVQATITLGGLGARTLGNLVDLIEAEGGISAERQGSGWSAWTREIAPGAVAPETLAEARDEIAAYFRTRTMEELALRAVENKLLIAPGAHDPERAERSATGSARVTGRRSVDGLIRVWQRSSAGRRWHCERPAPALGQDQSVLDEPARKRAASAEQCAAPARVRGAEGRGLRMGRRWADHRERRSPITVRRSCTSRAACGPTCCGSGRRSATGSRGSIGRSSSRTSTAQSSDSRSTWRCRRARNWLIASSIGRMWSSRASRRECWRLRAFHTNTWPRTGPTC